MFVKKAIIELTSAKAKAAEGGMIKLDNRYYFREDIESITMYYYDDVSEDGSEEFNVGKITYNNQLRPPCKMVILSDEEITKLLGEAQNSITVYTL